MQNSSVSRHKAAVPLRVWQYGGGSVTHQGVAVRGVQTLGPSQIDTVWVFRHTDRFQLFRLKIAQNVGAKHEKNFFCCLA